MSRTLTDRSSGAAGRDVVLRADDLRVTIPTPGGQVRAADGVSFVLRQGQTLGVVGETGSGKSVTCRALLGLRPSPRAVLSGSVTHPGLDDRNVLGLSPRQLRHRWGRHVALVPQNPMSALNPVRTIGDQVAEAVAASRALRGAALHRAVLQLLERVGIPAAARRLDDHPHQFSGGMLQRTLIAIALAGDPRVLVADEPTTALDVLVQDQILSLLVDLKRDVGMALVLVTHDLAVVAQMSDRIAVMYAGQFLETARTAQLLEDPRHPYTDALLHALPGAVARDQPLAVIPGSPPQLVDLPSSCRFLPRCARADPGCPGWRTELLTVGAVRDGGAAAAGRDGGEGTAGEHLTRCRRHDDLARLRDPGGGRTQDPTDHTDSGRDIAPQTRSTR